MDDIFCAKTLNTKSAWWGLESEAPSISSKEGVVMEYVPYSRIVRTSFLVGNENHPSFVIHSVLKKNTTYGVIPVYGETRRRIEQVIEDFKTACVRLKTPCFFAVSFPKPYNEEKILTYLVDVHNPRKERFLGTTIETRAEDRNLAICLLFDKIVF